MSEADKKKDTTPFYCAGHRQRLRARLLNSDLSGVGEDEMLEFILFSAIPRRDVKPIAKKLLLDFGSLNNLLDSDKEKLLSHDLISDSICLQLMLIKEILLRKLKLSVYKKNVIASWQELIKYLQESMGGLKSEQFRILFLNKRNILIADEVNSSGTIDMAAIYPREIVKRALFHEAGALILVHNHPGGSASPSKSDVEITKAIADACKAINVTIHDHVIITKDQYFSFKSNMLL